MPRFVEVSTRAFERGALRPLSTRFFSPKNRFRGKIFFWGSAPDPVMSDPTLDAPPRRSEGSSRPRGTGSHYTYSYESLLRVAFPEAVKRGGHAPNRSETCTFAPRNSPRVPNLHFVQIFELTVRWFTPPFACFGRSRPPDTPALTAATCTNAYDCGGNMPASISMRGLGRFRNLPLI